MLKICGNKLTKKIVYIKEYTVKKLIAGIIVAGLLMTGCVYLHDSVIKVSGDRLGFPVGGAIPVSGDDIKGYLIRRVYWTNEAGREIPPSPTVIVYEGSKGEDDKIVLKIETNFTHKEKTDE